MLSEILSRSTQLKVLQVTDNLKVELNNVYVIPPGTTITLKDGYLKLAARVQETIAKPINVFFTTLALEKKRTQ
jgi:two-component system CheB/CheR fusion protein